MPDLLLELFSEEIPARMQAQAADDLKRLVTAGLAERGLIGEGAAAFVTPRRLVLHIAGLAPHQPDVREEKKGPRVGAPEAAVQGFLKSVGLASLLEARIEKDPKKGDFYLAIIERKGQATLDVLAELLPEVIKSFPWPKSMRWGAASARSEALRWVRPLRSIVATFGPETEDPDVVPFSVEEITADRITYGHRFMAPGPIHVRRLDDYASALQKAKVVLDPARRREIILADAKTLALVQGLELIEDDALLEEVSGLIEWPVVLMGEFDARFLEIPQEVIRTTIRVNQKCFVLREPVQQKLANKFVLVANVEAHDGGAAIVGGNQRVVRARLSDAKFFWETDLSTRLEDRLPKLDKIVFHAKLGTQGARVQRLVALARDLASPAGAMPDQAGRAALLAKADLVTEMVGEFPELQGLMGRYYAHAQGEPAPIAAAIEEHYRPQGPTDSVPRTPTSIAVALADKIDTLVGFFAIDERPTGSKDPFALRRAALGIIRCILENDLRLPLRPVLVQALLNLKGSFKSSVVHGATPLFATGADDQFIATRETVLCDVLAFLGDRLKVYLREKGARYDLIDAVFGLGDQDDLQLIVRRVEALGTFLDGEAGQNLLAGYRRAANILRAEAKKLASDEAKLFSEPPSPELFIAPEEKALAESVASAGQQAAACIAAQDFEGAMRALSALRTPVDAFFDKVTVNAPDATLRLNRLRLLDQLRAAMHQVADFSHISG